MNGKKSSGKWEKIKTTINILAIFISVTAIIVSVYSYDLAKKDFELRNFSPAMGPADWSFEPLGDLEESGWTTFSNGTVKGTASGYLNISLRILTPHYAQITFKVENLSNIALDMLNPEMANQTEIALASLWRYKPPYIIEPGLTKLNVSLPLTAIIYPDSSGLPEGEDGWTQFPLGTLWLEAELYDLQTQTTSTMEIPALIFVKITAN
jgi:hypothetical protein